LFWKSFNEDEQKDYERTLVNACEHATNRYHSIVSNITVEELLDIIITAERYQLKDLVSACIKLTSKCHFGNFKKCGNFNKISSSTKLRMFSERLEIFENRYYCVTSSNTKIEDAYSGPK
jgi:hypothetical protein